MLKSLYRLFWVVEVTLFHIAKFIFGVWAFGWHPGFSAKRARQWATTLVTGLDIRISVCGTLPEQGVLIVANHRSYLDIVVILSQLDAAFLAKAELKSWPVFGWAAQKGNTVFVDRGSAASRAHARQAVVDRLNQGISVVVFPEGTTHAGPGILDFRNGIFKTARDAAIPTVPVWVFYENRDAAWVGDDDFVSHFLRLFKTPALKAHIGFGRPLSSQAPGDLKMACHSRIAREVAQKEHQYPALGV